MRPVLSFLTTSLSSSPPLLYLALLPPLRAVASLALLSQLLRLRSPLYPPSRALSLTAIHHTILT